MQRVALILLFVAGPAAAHPSGVAGFVHPFVGLDHLLAMLAVGLWAAQAGGRWTWAIPAAFVAAMAAGAASGLNAALVEPMVAASVLVLGLLIALKVRLHAAGAAIAALFAFFHGMAHAADLPAGADFASYFLGFLCATALLHAAGVGIGLLPQARYAGIPVAAAGAWLLGSALL